MAVITIDTDTGTVTASGPTSFTAVFAVLGAYLDGLTRDGRQSEPPPSQGPAAQSCPAPDTLPRAVRHEDGTVETYDAWCARASQGQGFPSGCSYVDIASLMPPPQVGERYEHYVTALRDAGWVPPAVPLIPADATWDGWSWVEL